MFLPQLKFAMFTAFLMPW